MNDLKEPLVAAVMITRDRPELMGKAIECFRAQRYANKVLVVLDTSASPKYPNAFSARSNEVHFTPAQGGDIQIDRSALTMSVGALRNRVNELACALPGLDSRPEIIIHLDDDDYSSPRRFDEQVSLLLGSGAEAVGYHSMPFWKVGATAAEIAAGGGRTAVGGSIQAGCRCSERSYDERCLKHPPQLWHYRGEPGYIIGTSLCYWTNTWKARRFLDVPFGEDSKFLDGTNVYNERLYTPLKTATFSGIPCMVARIHAQSVSSRAGHRRLVEGSPWQQCHDPFKIQKVKEIMA
jgi:hypothetical protein